MKSRGKSQLALTCLLFLLVLGLVGSFIPQAKANPTLFFTYDGTYYKIGNDEWNFTYVNDATNKWIWKDVKAFDGASWTTLYSSFSNQNPSYPNWLVVWYKDSSAEAFPLTTTNVKTNSSNLKELELIGSITSGAVTVTLTLTTSVNSTTVEFSFYFTMSGSLTFNAVFDTIVLRHAPAGLSGGSEEQYVYFPFGHVYHHKDNTFWYYEIFSNYTTHSGMGIMDMSELKYDDYHLSFKGTYTSIFYKVYPYVQFGGAFATVTNSIRQQLDTLFGSSNPSEVKSTTVLINPIPDYLLTYNWQDLNANEGSYYSASKFNLGWCSPWSPYAFYTLLRLNDLNGNTDMLTKATKLGNLIINHGQNSTYKYYYERLNSDGTPFTDINGEDYIWVHSQAWDILFLLKLYEKTSNASYLNSVTDSLNFWISKQNADGSWYMKYWRTLVPVGTETRFKTASASFFASALIEAYKITGNATYLTSARKTLDYIYINKLQYGTGTSGWVEDAYNAFYYADAESPYGIWATITSLGRVYEQTQNSTYLTWMTNLFNYHSIWMLKASGSWSKNLAYTPALVQTGWFYAVAVPPETIESLIWLYKTTLNLTYASEAIKIQRSSRQQQESGQALSYDYFHLIDNAYTGTNVWSTAGFLQNVISIKETFGDVYLGSQQLSLDSGVTVSGNGNGMYAYSATPRANITSAVYDSSAKRLTLVINAASAVTSTTKINVTAKGSPLRVTGASWSYDDATKIVTITKVHSSPATIILDWAETVFPSYGSQAVAYGFIAASLASVGFLVVVGLAFVKGSKPEDLIPLVIMGVGVFVAIFIMVVILSSLSGI